MHDLHVYVHGKKTLKQRFLGYVVISHTKMS